MKLEPAKGGVIGDVDLVLGIREKGRVFLKAGTEVGGGEGGFVSTDHHKIIDIIDRLAWYRT